MVGNVVVFDLEIQRDMAEVCGRDFLYRVGVSVGVSYNLGTSRFHHYLEHDLGRLVDELCGADLVVGFNIKAFDYPVLQSYTGFTLSTLPT